MCSPQQMQNANPNMLNTKTNEEMKQLDNIDVIDAKIIKTLWVTERTSPFLKDFIQIKQLGHGQYGVIYRCKRKSDGKYFAVKYLNKNRLYQININHRHQFLKKMRDEINMLKTVNHENIIKLESIYEDEGTLYIVMEECKGGELFHRIVKKKRYSEKDAANVLKQILSALRYLHDDIGIVHCDLKPSNILFLNEREDSPIKIIDFGMSRMLPRLQWLSTLCGTADYVAPEIIEKQKYNHSCDMWSVGVILYAMIYGYSPFYLPIDPQKFGKRERDAIYTKIVQGFEPKIKSTALYGYGAWFPDHIKTSEELRHFIGKLLEKNVRYRYRAKEALIHPWIVNDAYLNKHINSRIIRFNNACQYKYVIAIIFRDEFIKNRPETYHQLTQLFTKGNANQDAFATFQQLSESSESSGIGFTDILNILVYDYLISCDERLMDAFEKLDDDHDGKITTKELKQKLKKMSPEEEWNKSIQLIEQESMDKNAVICYEEFLTTLRPDFESNTCMDS